MTKVVEYFFCIFIVKTFPSSCVGSTQCMYTLGTTDAGFFFPSEVHHVLKLYYLITLKTLKVRIYGVHI